MNPQVSADLREKPSLRSTVESVSRNPRSRTAARQPRPDATRVCPRPAPLLHDKQNLDPQTGPSSETNRTPSDKHHSLHRIQCQSQQCRGVGETAYSLILNQALQCAPLPCRPRPDPRVHDPATVDKHSCPFSDP